jgi:hypothetical protein
MALPLTPPANVDDPRYLTELAVKNIVQQFAPAFQVLMTGDTTKHVHPCVLVRCRGNEEAIAKGTGTGNFKQRLEIELQLKLDQMDAEAQEQAVRSLRQCFYRNDTDPRPNVDLANRMSAAVAQPYTCKGVVSIDDGAVDVDAEIRVYSYKLIYDVFAIPNR